METYIIDIELNGKVYPMLVSGYYTKGEARTFNSPEVKETFEVVMVEFTPNATVDIINLLSYQYSWLVEDSFESMVEERILKIEEGKR